MSNVITPTKCRLCGEILKGGPQEALGAAIIINEKAGVKFVQRLVQHLQKKHPEELTKYTVQQAEFFGLLCLINFETTDEAVVMERDFMRWKLHKFTRRVVVSNERIVRKVDEMFSELQKELNTGMSIEDKLKLEWLTDNHLKPRVAHLLYAMRDIFEERGRYNDAPVNPAQSPAPPENGAPDPAA